VFPDTLEMNNGTVRVISGQKLASLKKTSILYVTILTPFMCVVILLRIVVPKERIEPSVSRRAVPTAEAQVPSTQNVYVQVGILQDVTILDK
jgi:hypothetical protein